MSAEQCHDKFCFTYSFDGVCKQYQPNGEEKLCQRCQSSTAHHKLSVKKGALSHAFSSLLTAFAAVRNVRVMISNGIPPSSAHLVELKSSLKTVEGLTVSAGGGGPTAELLAVTSTLRRLPPDQAKDSAIRYTIVSPFPFHSCMLFLTYHVHSVVTSFLAQADTFYYQLFYDLELAKRVSNNPTLVPSIPDPNIYFTEYAVDAAQQNEVLKEYIEDNFSADYKQLISEVFGFLDTTFLPFQHNPLLLLHFARWRESVCLLTRSAQISTDLPTLLSLCSPTTPTHASMKIAGDPLLPPLTRLWNDSCRVWACHLYAYATPCPAALDALARRAPLVEVGAGTGYWAHCLRRRHLSIKLTAFDKNPPSAAPSHRSNGYHGRAAAWSSVLRGGAEEAGRHAGAALFLCYPPPDSGESLAGCLDVQCFAGDYLVGCLMKVCHVLFRYGSASREELYRTGAVPRGGVFWGQRHQKF